MDRVHDRIFIPGPGNGRVVGYQLNENGQPQDYTGDYFLGQASGYGRRVSSGDVRAASLPFPGTPTVDEVNQRLFVPDRTVTAWSGGGRIMVYNIHPERIRTGGEAVAVIGAPDFESRRLGIGPNVMSSASPLADGANQRLFVTDRGNQRILVFDISPGRFTSNPDAVAVIGQPDFYSRDTGTGPNHFNGPGSATLDKSHQRLFVSDSGNNRILIFDVHPDRFQSNPSAIYVLGQPDFESRDSTPASDTPQIRPGSLVYDEANDRLLVSDSSNNRVLSFDVHPERMTHYPAALGVVGQPDLTTVESELLTYDPAYAQSKTDRPRISSGSFDPDNQLLYISEGYYSGNRVGIFDASPRAMAEGRSLMVDVIGHVDDNGNPSYTRRSANDRVDGRTHYPRSVAHDPVDHRLFTIDQYNHRVLVWRLDAYNRILGREAEVVIGQEDFYSAVISPPTSRTFRLPSAVGYDPRHKLLFVGDGWYNRVMVFDADPERLKNFPEAVVVLGQPDFTSANSEMTQRSTNFDVAVGRHGITSGNPRAMGFAVDSEGERLFVSDGPNYRVMVFDISPDALITNAPAIAVLGKSDFTSGRSVLNQRRSSGGDPFAPQPLAASTGRSAFSSMPGDLTFDPNHQRLFVIDGRSHRVLVFDAHPGRLENGASAIAVIGQPDFDSTGSVRLDTESVSEQEGRRRLRWPDGIAYDSKNDRLVLSDKGNDRVLFFDVAPSKLENGIAASAVIGQEDFVSRDPGRGRQDEMMDVRGIAFDSEHQRLYATDSFWARVMVFDLARATRNYNIPRGGVRSYSTIDASTLETQPLLNGYAEVTASDTLSAMAVYSLTNVQFDERAWRENRVLVSETAIAAPPLANTAHVFVQWDARQDTIIMIANPDNAVAELNFTVRDSGGNEVTLRGTQGSANVGVGEQITISAVELLGNRSESFVTLMVQSSVPVAISALGVIQNGRDEEVLVAMPVWHGGSGVPVPEPAVVPKVIHGGGYQTQLILANTRDDTSSGEIMIYSPSGAPALEAPVSFSISPNGTFIYLHEGESSLPRAGYAIVTFARGVTSVASLVTLTDGDVTISASRTDTAREARQSWVPVNTQPTTIRHGRVQHEVSVTNNNPVPASLRFILYGPGGHETDRRELILPNEQQQDFTIAELFGRTQFTGTLRIASEPAVHISAEQRTQNLRDEPIAMQIPLITEPTGYVLPHFIDGKGYATELFLVNTSTAGIEGELTTFAPDGSDLSLPLR